MASFTPRAVFPALDSIKHSYFLGHHRAGLAKMKTAVSQMDLVIECRDYRIPITSRNPLFEETLGEKERLIVYTKRDLGSNRAAADAMREDMISKWHHPAKALFCDCRNVHSGRGGARDVRRILEYARDFASRRESLTGHRMMVVGMPNVGKSTLLNALRVLGVGKGKAAKTGAFPGVTRTLSTSVKIIDGGADGGSLYLVDTPGVFMPHVPGSEEMLKLSLCGSVKYGLINMVTLADYLLFHINRVSPALYAEFNPPTNDIMPLLEAIARKSGKLCPGGEPDTLQAADWLISRWRKGHFGHFVLDNVTDDALEKARLADQEKSPSFNQAMKAEKASRRLRSQAHSPLAV